MRVHESDSACRALKESEGGPLPAPAGEVAQMVKNLPVVQETQVQFLGQEDPLEVEMATTPVFLPGEFDGQRSLAGY